MQVLEKSRFSWLTGVSGATPSGPWDVELCGTRRFAAVPSLGALVPGWSLIIPRRPMISLRDLSEGERVELFEFHSHVAQKLEPLGGTVFAFEHGSATLGAVSGCGVDQAHLHLVPLDFDLVELALACNDGVSWSKVNEIPLGSLPDEGEYIIAWQVGRSDGVIGIVRRPVSQWMRQLIAHKLGIKAQWNYRTNPHLENVQATIQNFAT